MGSPWLVFFHWRLVHFPRVCADLHAFLPAGAPRLQFADDEAAGSEGDEEAGEGEAGDRGSQDEYDPADLDDTGMRPHGEINCRNGSQAR